MRRSDEVGGRDFVCLIEYLRDVRKTKNGRKDQCVKGILNLLELLMSCLS